VFQNLIVITGIYPPDPGGPAKFASEFSSWSLDKLPRVTVISYFDQRELNESDSKLLFIGVKRFGSVFKRYLRMIRSIGRVAKHRSYVLSVGAFLETCIASIIYKFDYVVKVPGDIVWERARNNRQTDLDIDSFQASSLTFKYRVFRLLFTQSLLRASLVVVPSEGLYKLCRRWGVPESRLVLIRNSVDLEKYSGISRTQMDFEILTICRLTPWKGVDELIRYCAERKIKLAVAGDGPERSRLETLSKSLEANVTFFGDINEEAVMGLLGRSRIFVLNSYYEGLPHALVEARAAGLISVARDGTGSAEVITDGVNGFLIGNGRTLPQTIDLALSESLKQNDIGSLAASDAKTRFNREINFSHILVAVTEVKR